jgi:hypothetical protein
MPIRVQDPTKAVFCCGCYVEMNLFQISCCLKIIHVFIFLTNMRGLKCHRECAILFSYQVGIRCRAKSHKECAVLLVIK